MYSQQALQRAGSSAPSFARYDVDASNTIDFDEFCAMSRSPSKASLTAAPQSDDELRVLFDAIDADHSGTIDRREYLRYALLDALSASSDRLVDVFKAWQEAGGQRRIGK